ncbi:MAG: ribonucleoside-diphosphate reductase alpha chain [Parcubacteria group bacterium Gr01-1014_66]|nr:MAG: ribonucleoside-diphosphate reductase alpha chain [Parcubacteria group bacterium Gr01-1014_66]
MPRATVTAPFVSRRGVSAKGQSVKLAIKRVFTKEGMHPFDQVKWKKVSIMVRGSGMNTTAEERELEFPEFWSENACSIAGSKYFRGRIGSPERESSAKQMIARVVETIRNWGLQFKHLYDEEQADIFADELTHILLHQKAAFNSPVWFNVGIAEKPQCSACFLLAVEDNMESILEWVSTEGLIFKGGSGSGVNLSPLRSSKETLSAGGRSSGPVAFMRGADSVAGMIASGGSTRRAAKMVVLNIDHPDIMLFIRCKAEEEKKVRALIEAGYEMYDLNNPAWNSVQYQNANNSVRVTDEYMAAVEHDEVWMTRYVTTGAVVEEYRARDLMRAIAQAAWESGDPGIQYDTTINRWHTCPNSGRITTSNPCFTGNTLVSTDRGLIRFDALYERFQSGEKIRVFTHNSTSKEYTQELMSVTRPTDVMMTGIHDIYRLVFSNGAEVRATKNHRFFTRNRGMVAAEELRPEDEIVIATQPLLFECASLALHLNEALIFAHGWGGRATKMHEPVKIPTVWTVPFAHYVGYLVGDGSIRAASGPQSRTSNASVVFGTQEEAHELTPQFIQLFQDWGVGGYSLIMPNGTLQLRTNRTPIVRMLEQIGVSSKKAPYKVVPHAIFQAPQSIQSAFLRGLFTADGCVYDGATHRYVGLGSASKELLQGVQQLLLVQGVFSRISQIRHADATSSFSYIRQDGTNIVYKSHPSYDLRISSRSIAHFKERIGFLTTKKQNKLANLVTRHEFHHTEENRVHLKEMRYEGQEFTYNLTEPKNHSYIANGFVVANCSEYLHIDNSACNLASLNLLTYLNQDGTFNVRAFIHAVDIMILAQEIIVDGSSYPTEKIGKNAHAFRELGLGYANLGALLMAWGYPYDSDAARHSAAAITALLTGEAYRYSAEIARRMAPYEGYLENKEPQLHVINMHRDALNRVRPGLVADRAIFDAARRAWDDALILGKRHGVRNSQISLIAPTGTIALMMDCATTGIEPEFALVKMKKLVGGGTMKFVNTTVPQALEKLGYRTEERAEILSYLEQHGTVEGAPHLKEDHLAVFDCAVKPAAGNRVISWQGHVKMVAAAQPFLSGAISKTFNMPAETSVEEIMDAYMMGWKLGLKAFAVYRDGSKAAQPLTTFGSKGGAKKDALQPVRRHLPLTRPSETHKFSIAGHEGFLTYSMYEDGTLGEIFIRMSKQGSTLAGLIDAFAIGISIALQYGVPLKSMARRFSYSRFEPAGYTMNPAIQVATSITDYIFRYLALRFLSEADLDELGIRSPAKELTTDTAEKEGSDEGEKRAFRFSPSGAPVAINPNGPESMRIVYADSVCRACGGMLIQTGTCKTCIQCGTSTGGC